MTQRQNSIDRHVGSRIRMRRMILNLSLANVANKLGVTLQQIQKYEKGISEIAASRLEHISHILQVPVGFFFEDESTQIPPRKTDPIADINEFMATKEGLALAKAYMRISSEKLRQQIVRLVTDLGQSREAAD
jgi:transcriptional regulator with XRE-family HTH domain